MVSRSSLLFLVGKYHTNNDEQAAEQKPKGDLLVQQPPGKDNGSDGIEIDPVGGYDSTQLMDDPTPDKETNHRSDNTQEQQVPEHFTTENDFHRREAREHDVVGQDGQQSVEEHLACNEKDRIAFSYRLHQ